MEDTYRSRICPICGGVVSCNLGYTANEPDGSFRINFKATCEGCGIYIEGWDSRMFGLFLDRKPSKLVTDAFMDVDNKWVYCTATYR